MQIDFHAGNIYLASLLCPEMTLRTGFNKSVRQISCLSGALTWLQFHLTAIPLENYCAPFQLFSCESPLTMTHYLHLKQFWNKSLHASALAIQWWFSNSTMMDYCHMHHKKTYIMSTLMKSDHKISSKLPSIISKIVCDASYQQLLTLCLWFCVVPFSVYKWAFLLLVHLQLAHVCLKPQYLKCAVS